MFNEETTGFSIREIHEDSLHWLRGTPFPKEKDLRNDRFHRHAGHGDIRAAGLPLIRDKVFDGRFRPIFQPGGKIGKATVQSL